ncbi:S-adenosyl-L-methionine-dependent methyltransferase [Gorgonomyces haynaldii]|nr:S-adenosyl-L-methionine-dependent methyltransferase [Gorgonomyces haynaldii]
MLEYQLDKAKNPNDTIRQKLYDQAKRNWDIFYKHNKQNFFKDRHWTRREFPELNELGTQRKLLELGCGVGNFAFPMLANQDFDIYCCDFSPRAVEMVQKDEKYNPERMHAFVCDLTKDNLSDSCQNVDVVSCIFVLSAIPPHKLSQTIQNIKSVMKPGAVLILRDYAQFDQAQLRFKAQNYLEPNVYCRHDGTLSVFFEKESLIQAFEDNGFTTLECEIVERTVVNRAQEKTMHRRFIQARFQRSSLEISCSGET